MILYDGLFINNGGGKVLQDYLIERLEESEIEVYYLLDLRVKVKHPLIKNNKVEYLKGSFLERHLFYRKHRKDFHKVFCFGNLPPSVKLNSTVYTYLHQRLYLEIPKEFSFLNKFLFTLKSRVMITLSKNTDKWIVQSGQMKEGLMSKYGIANENILLIPFYPTIRKSTINNKKKNTFLYVSDGSTHKNHIRLINAFSKLYEKNKVGELHLTIGRRFTSLINYIDEMFGQGYPVINHGIVKHSELSSLYSDAEYVIYPSLSESFGLGIFEALAHDCKIIGADRPYMHAACIPTLIFDPESEEQIEECFNKAIKEKLKSSIQLTFNEVEKILDLLPIPFGQVKNL